MQKLKTAEVVAVVTLWKVVQQPAKMCQIQNASYIVVLSKCRRYHWKVPLLKVGKNCALALLSCAGFIYS